MGLTISETDILATTSKGIVVSNQDILNHLASLKNKTQTKNILELMGEVIIKLLMLKKGMMIIS